MKGPALDQKADAKSERPIAEEITLQNVLAQMPEAYRTGIQIVIKQTEQPTDKAFELQAQKIHSTQLLR
jgi:hypothetical protein